ncbi:SMP-30/gluconolactonase/LRE family protein [Paracoccus sp. IB05]|uniref:SMP-30/gluconolactonase/LRE family protein n=1 Tax=Paracoccus sp. IB05 TaxID=2779367 RepID=UPI0018E8333E|nr:SMP-30/gluconolactonase/LRE family protein [Paracoccus sp. IB05]
MVGGRWPAAEPLFTPEDWPRLRLNDGRSDPEGRLRIGSMRSIVGPKGEQLEAGGTDGTLCRISPDGVAPQRSGIGVPNRLCRAPDGRSFCFADTLADVIWRHDFDAETRRIGPPEVLIEKAGPGWPDGSVIDTDGCLWNCRFGGGAVLHITPKGKVDRVIGMPAGSPTIVRFGGPGPDTLYVTSASVGTAADDQMAGCLFALQPGVQGLPENISLF